MRSLGTPATRSGCKLTASRAWPGALQRINGGNAVNANKQLGSAFESRVVERAKAKGLKARKQPGSGVYKGLPNDVVIEDVLVECKVRSTTLTAKGEKRLTLDLDWLRGVQAAAEREGFRQGIVVVNAKGSSKPLVLCDYEFVLELLNLQRRN